METTNKISICHRIFPWADCLPECCLSSTISYPQWLNQELPLTDNRDRHDYSHRNLRFQRWCRRSTPRVQNHPRDQLEQIPLSRLFSRIVLRNVYCITFGIVEISEISHAYFRNCRHTCIRTLPRCSISGGNSRTVEPFLKLAPSTHRLLHPLTFPPL